MIDPYFQNNFSVIASLSPHGVVIFLKEQSWERRRPRRLGYAGSVPTRTSAFPGCKLFFRDKPRAEG